LRHALAASRTWKFNAHFRPCLCGRDEFNLAVHSCNALPHAAHAEVFASIAYLFRVKAAAVVGDYNQNAVFFCTADDERNIVRLCVLYYIGERLLPTRRNTWSCLSGRKFFQAECRRNGK